MYDVQSHFLEKPVLAFAFPIREIQTDNGKVERQHRPDEKRFYKKMKMQNLADGRKQLLAYNKKSNSIPKICLDFKTPNYVATSFSSTYTFSGNCPASLTMLQ